MDLSKHGTVRNVPLQFISGQRQMEYERSGKAAPSRSGTASVASPAAARAEIPPEPGGIDGRRPVAG